MGKINYKMLSLLLFLIIILYLGYLYINYIYLNKCGMEGKYMRIYGDNQQPTYMHNVKNGRKTEFIYYNDNNQMVDKGSSSQSLMNKTGSAKHNSSSSTCHKLYLSNDNSISVCKGNANQKFNKSNVKYTSYHKYYKVNGNVYYENTYIFDNGDISFAIYKKM